ETPKTGRSRRRPDRRALPGRETAQPGSGNSRGRGNSEERPMSPTTAVLLGLIAHVVGDYLLQSSWMAARKASEWWPALAHALTYGLPFVVITRDPAALFVIVS